MLSCTSTGTGYWNFYTPLALEVHKCVKRKKIGTGKKHSAKFKLFVFKMCFFVRCMNDNLKNKYYKLKT